MRTNHWRLVTISSGWLAVLVELDRLGDRAGARGQVARPGAAGRRPLPGPAEGLAGQLVVARGRPPGRRSRPGRAPGDRPDGAVAGRRTEPHGQPQLPPPDHVGRGRRRCRSWRARSPCRGRPAGGRAPGRAPRTAAWSRSCRPGRGSGRRRGGRPGPRRRPAAPAGSSRPSDGPSVRTAAGRPCPRPRGPRPRPGPRRSGSHLPQGRGLGLVGLALGQQAQEPALRGPPGLLADGGVGQRPVDRQPELAPEVASNACSSASVRLAAQLDEVGPRDGDRLGRDGPPGGSKAGVVGQRRVAADPVVVLDPALGRQAVVVPAHRVEHRPPAHPLEAGEDVGVAVGEDVADVQRPADRQAAGSRSSTPPPGAGVRSKR